MNEERYKQNRVVRYLLITSTADLNQLWEMYELNDLFSLEEMKEFYKLIGYSKSGFNEIFDNDDGWVEAPIFKIDGTYPPNKLKEDE